MMMIMGSRENFHSNPTIQVPPWDSFLEDPTANIPSPFSVNGGNAGLFDDLTATALRRYLPSNTEMAEFDDVLEEEEEEEFSCDDFRMYEFKVRRCARGRSHDWTECPFAHPGEKARRRDPRKVHYSGDPCPEFRKGQCKKGDSCEFAHGVFECWLHPSRYRTQPCKDGVQCRRRICFFAHTADQLRSLSSPGQPESYDGSPSRLAMAKGSFRLESPTSILYSPPRSPPSESPPMSPIASLGLNSVRELASSVRSLQIGKAARLSLSLSPMGAGFCSPRSPSNLRPGLNSLPTTPTRNPRLKAFDLWEWDQRSTTEEEPVMERVESGKELRAKIYAKLGRENSLAVRDDSSGSHPDVGWVSELVK